MTLKDDLKTALIRNRDPNTGRELSEEAKKVYEVILFNSPVRQHKIVTILGDNGIKTNKQTVKHHVDRLIRMGFIKNFPMWIDAGERKRIIEVYKVDMKRFLLDAILNSFHIGTETDLDSFFALAGERIQELGIEELINNEKTYEQFDFVAKNLVKPILEEKKLIYQGKADFFNALKFDTVKTSNFMKLHHRKLSSYVRIANNLHKLFMYAPVIRFKVESHVKDMGKRKGRSREKTQKIVNRNY